jgi:hypothetical protein
MIIIIIVVIIIVRALALQRLAVTICTYYTIINDKVTCMFQVIQ